MHQKFGKMFEMFIQFYFTMLLTQKRGRKLIIGTDTANLGN